MANCYYVCDDGCIEKMSTTEVKGIARVVMDVTPSTKWPRSLAAARSVITASSSYIAESVCFSYAEAKALAEARKAIRR